MWYSALVESFPICDFSAYLSSFALSGDICLCLSNSFSLDACYSFSLWMWSIKSLLSVRGLCRMALDFVMSLGLGFDAWDICFEIWNPALSQLLSIIMCLECWRPSLLVSSNLTHNYRLWFHISISSLVKCMDLLVMTIRRCLTRPFVCD